MVRPQLSVRSAKAKALAQALSARTGQPIGEVVEQALELYDNELREQSASTPLDALLRLMAEGRPTVPVGTTSSYDDFYDEHGLPK